MSTSDFAAALDSNDISMSYGKETQWGQKPSVQFQDIRIDKESLAGTKSRKRPDELSAERQSSAAITTKMETQGSIDFSVSAGTHNDLVASSIGGEFTTPIAFASKTTVAATASGFTDSGNGFVSAGIVQGQMIKVSGFTGASAAQINGIYRVNSVVAGTIQTTPVPGATKVAGDTITIKGSMCRNGATFNSFFIQKKLSSDKYLVFPGSWPNSGSMEVAVDSYLTGNINFLCKSQDKAITDQSTGAHLAAPTGRVIDAINGIGQIFRNGTAVDAIINKFSLKWTKEGSAAQYGIGSSAAQGMRLGKVNVTGGLTSFFRDFALYDEFIAETGGPIWMPALDYDGHGYVLTICNGTIMNPKIVAGGSNQDVVAEFDIEGNPDTTGIYGYRTIQIDYFGA